MRESTLPPAHVPPSGPLDTSRVEGGRAQHRTAQIHDRDPPPPPPACHCPRCGASCDTAGAAGDALCVGAPVCAPVPLAAGAVARQPVLHAASCARPARGEADALRAARRRAAQPAGPSGARDARGALLVLAAGGRAPGESGGGQAGTRAARGRTAWARAGREGWLRGPWPRGLWLRRVVGREGMTVAARRPQVYSATLHLRTSFGVVAALMHTWFFTTAAVGVTLLMLMYWLVVLVFELRDRLRAQDDLEDQQYQQFQPSRAAPDSRCRPVPPIAGSSKSD
mmetsp:Transcript_21805/g.63754  ORF Transcript_21805/g.63754 Transcript_21805/m.63754 type:complete len:282 (-) Transcript_21805:15-860(-)